MFGGAGNSVSAKRCRGFAGAALLVAVFLLAAATAKADLSEDFNLVPPAGWTISNQSEPPGSQSWFQGTSSVFAAHQGEPAAYVAANFTSVDGEGTISSWLITPVLTTLSNGDLYSFFTRRPETTGFPDRMEFRLSADATCSSGTGSGSVGTFTMLLESLNPDLEAGGYPEAWTEVSGRIEGLPPGNHTGCLAFRYFVTEAGSAGTNGNYIGVDTFRFTDTQPLLPVRITGTDPVSPHSNLKPRVQGTGALADATVNIYASTNCSGSPVGSGPGTEFNGAGITVTVGKNKTTPLSADATRASVTSGCSNTATYTHKPADPPAKCRKAGRALKRAKARQRAVTKRLRKLQTRKAARPRVRAARRQVRKVKRQVRRKARARRAACR